MYFTIHMVLLYFVMLLSGFVVVHWDCHIYHNLSVMLLVNHHYLWLGDQQLLVCLEIKVPQDIGQRWFRGDSHWDLGTLKPHVYLFYPSHLAVPLSVYCPSLQLISWYMLDSLWGTFAQRATWVPLALEDSSG